MENREQVNWLKICWIRFCKSAPYTILYKTSMEDTEFKSLDLSPTCQERSPNLKKIILAPLYRDAKPIIGESFDKFGKFS